MTNRRQFLKSSLQTTIASSALGPWFVQAALGSHSDSTRPTVKTSLGTPSPPQPWSGIRDAVELGPPAPQETDDGATDDARKFADDWRGPGQTSEDCLVLHVWTPSLHREKRPVMVWLHGGYYSTGSGGGSLYDGTNLSAKHDVVLVTVNHNLESAR